MPQAPDLQKIKRAAHNNIPLAIKTYTMPRDTESYIEQVLGSFLKEIGCDNIVNPISYCVKEMAVNAKKANTKRVYFKERDLDILDNDDYEEGMKTFKDDTLSNIQHYLVIQKEQGLYVRVVFRSNVRTLRVTVSNNVEITRKEQMRVYDRIARSRAFDSMEEAFSTVLDSSEGAGLGIVIMVLMLKKIGLTEDAFEIDVVDGETVARITVPISGVHLEKVDVLAQMVVNEINSLPQFPENLVYLQKLIADPESDIQDIARQVSTDPSLTADLLKLVNSAVYMLPNKIDSIADAVKMVGMRGLRNLLYKYGSQKILEEKYTEMRELWKHSYQVAFYSFNLAKAFRLKTDIMDDVFVGGILHDLGKIVVNALHPDLLDKIKRFCIQKGISAKILEGMSVGMNHAEIGAMIAAKWNFPEQLIAAIRGHHEPLDCNPQYKDIVYVVYLSDTISNVQRKLLEYEQIEPTVLRYFGLDTLESFHKITERLSRNYSEDLLLGEGSLI
jgi:putative nucleotidyltransferase with HDIG domain